MGLQAGGAVGADLFAVLAGPCQPHLPGHVVVVLLREEPAPAVPTHVRDLAPRIHPRVPVRFVDASDLIATFVLAKPSVQGIDRGRGVSPLGQEAGGLCAARVIDANIEEIP